MSHHLVEPTACTPPTWFSTWPFSQPAAAHPEQPDGVAVTLKVAQVRLCHSRMLYVRAYPRETQEMVFDAHEKAFAFFKGVPRRGIYDNMATAVDAVFVDAEEIPEEVDARLGEIETALGEFEGRPVPYDAAEIARAGVFVSIGTDGSLHAFIGRKFLDELADELPKGLDRARGALRSAALSLAARPARMAAAWAAAVSPTSSSARSTTAAGTGSASSAGRTAAGAGLVIRTFGAEPWRLGANDYAAYANSSTGQLLTGAPVAACWDASLAPTMQARGLAIPEEAVAATLLEDLER